MKTMTTLFLSAQYQSALSRHQFDDFESIWASEIKWFEEPNQRRGGWSGVGRIELSHNDVNFLNIFVKKQKKHWNSAFGGATEGRMQAQPAQPVRDLGFPRNFCCSLVQNGSEE